MYKTFPHQKNWLDIFVFWVMIPNFIMSIFSGDNMAMWGHFRRQSYTEALCGVIFVLSCMTRISKGALFTIWVNCGMYVTNVSLYDRINIIYQGSIFLIRYMLPDENVLKIQVHLEHVINFNISDMVKDHCINVPFMSTINIQSFHRCLK